MIRISASGWVMLAARVLFHDTQQRLLHKA
jgi:hypothetical protein